MSESDRGGIIRRAALADVVAGVLLSLVFAAALVPALGWTGKAAIFPLAVAGVGGLLALGFVVRALVLSPSHEGGGVQLGNLGDDDEDSDDEFEYAFATACPEEWRIALGFFLGFFIALYLLGLYLTAPLFTLVYLRREAKVSWGFAVGYSVILGVVLYLAFAVVMGVPMPSGSIQ